MVEPEGEKRNPESNTNRIEAFSDGVFAIAITLLILEIKLPALPNASGQQLLRPALISLWPAYLTYVFSFLMIGIYWANHQYVFQFYLKSDHIFNLLNVLFLMCICFFPFPTEVLGEYVMRNEDRQTVVIFYCLSLLSLAATWSITWYYASRNYRLIDRNLEPAFVQFLTRQYLFSSLFYGLMLAVSFWNADLALILGVGFTLLYLFPPKTPLYRKEKG